MVHCTILRIKEKLLNKLGIYPDGTYDENGKPNEPLLIPVANGFVSRCVSAISNNNIPDAEHAAEILNKHFGEK